MSGSALARELQNVRQQSVIATRAGDFRKVGALSLRAAQLNDHLKQAQAEEHATAAANG
jgi:hypothetical protein